MTSKTFKYKRLLIFGGVGGVKYLLSEEIKSNLSHVKTTCVAQISCGVNALDPFCTRKNRKIKAKL